MRSDCSTATGGVVSTTFSPNPQTSTGGEDVVFTETISVAADAPGGTYTCRDWAVIVTPDGTATRMGDDPSTAADETIYEVKTIKVPEGWLTSGGNLEERSGSSTERISWGGNVGFTADFGIVGEWNTNFHDVAGTVARRRALPRPRDHEPPVLAGRGARGRDSLRRTPTSRRFIASGTLDGTPGYQLRVCVADRGEPGKGNDTMRMTLFAPGPVLVYDSLTSGDFADQAPASACDGHELDGGNNQMHAGLK